MEPIEIYRIEDENGRGPFFDLHTSYIPKEILEPMWDIIPAPHCDFPDLDRYYPFSKFCLERLKHHHEEVFFGFPSYDIFKKLVGEYEEEIAEYVTTYKTDNYIISKSGLQVMFTK